MVMNNDSSDLLYSEKQKVSGFFRWFIIGDAILVLTVFLIILKFVIKETQEIPLPFLLIMFSMPLAVLAVFMSVRLETEVRFDGLYFRFFPFHLGFQKIDYADISECYAREFKPVQDFGGWGIRYTLTKGKAYILKGKTGLQIVLKNGKKILISSDEPQELVNAMSSFIKH